MKIKFPIINRVMPSLIAKDFIDVQPMTFHYHSLEGPIMGPSIFYAGYIDKQGAHHTKGTNEQYWIHDVQYSKEDYYKHPEVRAYQASKGKSEDILSI